MHKFFLYYYLHNLVNPLTKITLKWYDGLKKTYLFTNKFSRIIANKSEDSIVGFSHIKGGKDGKTRQA